MMESNLVDVSTLDLGQNELVFRYNSMLEAKSHITFQIQTLMTKTMKDNRAVFHGGSRGSSKVSLGTVMHYLSRLRRKPTPSQPTE
jgi:hypothetical protein